MKKSEEFKDKLAESIGTALAKAFQENKLFESVSTDEEEYFNALLAAVEATDPALAQRLKDWHLKLKLAKDVATKLENAAKTSKRSTRKSYGTMGDAEDYVYSSCGTPSRRRSTSYSGCGGSSSYNRSSC